MSRRERRQIKREQQKSDTKKEPYEPVSKGARIFVAIASLSIIFFALYLALRNNNIPDNDLSTVYVTLKDQPRYDEYKIKSTTYRDIILTTKEYNRDFVIGGMDYNATKHQAFKSDIKAGDKVALNVKTSDLDDLNANTFWNNHNAVYGLSKDGIKYVDMALSTELSDKDSKWAYFFVMIGMVMLPYAFIKGKPFISLDKAMTITAIIGLIVFLIIGKL